MNAFTSVYSADRHAHPEEHAFHYLSYDECARIGTGQHVLARRLDGKVAQVKITSIKRWRTRPDIRIGWKYGMYEFGNFTILPGDTSTLLCSQD